MPPKVLKCGDINEAQICGDNNVEHALSIIPKVANMDFSLGRYEYDSGGVVLPLVHQWHNKACG